MIEWIVGWVDDGRSECSGRFFYLRRKEQRGCERCRADAWRMRAGADRGARCGGIKNKTGWLNQPVLFCFKLKHDFPTNKADKRHDMESKRRISAGKARTIGEQHLCENCGKPYILASGMQKWCMMCRDAMYTEMQRRTSREWNAKAYEDPLKREEKNAHVRVSKPQQINCGICGKLFERTDGVTIYCSDECRKKAIKRRQHISDAKRAEKRKADRRERNEKDHQ